jgi:membrane-associated phospholipid phosphatase
LVRFSADFGRGGMAWVALALLARRSAQRRGMLPPSRAVVITPVWGSFAASFFVARVIGRNRPCHERSGAMTNCPDGPSFPSDQAAAAFAGALVLGKLAPPARLPALVAATITSLARVRLGFHHPSDIAAGALLGMLAAASAVQSG